MKRQQFDINADVLASEFSACLRQDLTPLQMFIVKQRNQSQSSPHICHSHDFCDANMTMLRAFESIFDREPADVFEPIQQDIDQALWNRAWSIAKANGFTIEDIDD